MICHVDAIHIPMVESLVAHEQFGFRSHFIERAGMAIEDRLPRCEQLLIEHVLRIGGIE